MGFPVLAMVLITTNLITGALLGLALFVDRVGIINMLKLKIKKGYGLILLIGKDKKLYETTAKFSGKTTETEQITINGLPYNLNRKKIIFKKTHPVLMYDEGVSEPLSVTSGELSYGKMTPELLSQMLVLARQSGKMPQGTNKNQQIMFYLSIGTMIASGLALWFLFSQGNQINTLTDLGNTILTAVNTRVAGG